MLNAETEAADCFVYLYLDNPFAGDNQYAFTYNGTQCPKYMKVEQGYYSRGDYAAAEFFVYYDMEEAFWDTSDLINKYDPNNQDFSLDPEAPVDPNCDPDNPLIACASSIGKAFNASVPAPSPAPGSASSYTATGFIISFATVAATLSLMKWIVLSYH